MSEGDLVQLQVRLGSLNLALSQSVNAGGQRITHCAVEEDPLPGPQAAGAGSAAGAAPTQATAAEASSSAGPYREPSAPAAPQAAPSVPEPTAESHGDPAEEEALPAEVFYLARAIRVVRGATPLRRITVAYRAGQRAKQQLAGARTSEDAEDLGLDKKVFVVLRALGESGAPRTRVLFKREAYYALVGYPPHFDGTIHHSFASQAEARAYLAGAGLRWP